MDRTHSTSLTEDERDDMRRFFGGESLRVLVDLREKVGLLSRLLEAVFLMRFVNNTKQVDEEEYNEFLLLRSRLYELLEYFKEVQFNGKS